jgi:pyruvate kinase
VFQKKRKEKTMNSFQPEHSRIIRTQDNQLLRTKIVATIGDPEKYDDGFFDENNERQAQLSYDYLVRKFYENGVDVIRLNLSHLKPKEIAGMFRQIKKAILECEHKNGNRKKIAILADLPGPKIRFKMAGQRTFKMGQDFTVHFERKVSRDGEETVYLDDEPLKIGLALAADKRAIKEPEGLKKIRPRLRENVIGVLRQEVSLRRIMDYLGSALKGREGGESVFVTVGDGEVIMRVHPGFDPNGTTITCQVISIRGEQRDEYTNEPVFTFNGTEDKPAKKGFTLRGVDFNIPSFTAGDKQRLDELLKAEYEGYDKRGWEPVVAFIGLSFAQTADDVLSIKEHIENKLVTDYKFSPGEARLKSPSIIAKIETRKGWLNTDHILDVADGIMVARGDLGLQMEVEEVPAIQKRLIQLCNKRGKPVITATQMLMTMTRSIEPTRAEGTDVFNAILDGSDAVMMSEETASGKYPPHAIRKMIKIAVQAERHFELLDDRSLDPDMDERSSDPDTGRDFRRRANLRRYQEFLKDEAARVKADEVRLDAAERVLSKRKQVVKNDEEKRRMEWRRSLYEEKAGKNQQQQTTDRITQATCTMSEGEDIEGIIAATTSGRTVRMISRLRPNVLVVGAAHDLINTRKLAVSYGVIPICIGRVSDYGGAKRIFTNCRKRIREDEYLNSRLSDETTVIFTAGTPTGKPGTTNLILMRKIDE